MGGSAVGGAAAEATREAISGQPLNPGSIATAGGTQAAADVVGRGIAKGARFVGRLGMQAAVKPLLSHVQEFTDQLVPTMIRERIPVGRIPAIGRTLGSDIASSRRQESAQALKSVLADARKAGVSYRPDDLLGPVQQLVSDLRGQPLNKADIASVQSMVQEFRATHPGPLTPEAVKTLKQNAWALARPVLKAEKTAPGAAQADRVIEARFNRALGQGAEQALSQLSSLRQPWSGPRTVRGIEARTKSLIGAQRATQRAEQTLATGIPLIPRGWGGWVLGPGAGAALGGLSPSESPQERVGKAVGGGIAGAMTMSPPVLSRLSLAMTDPYTQFFLRQMLTRAAAGLAFPPADSTQGGQ